MDNKEKDISLEDGIAFIDKAMNTPISRHALCRGIAVATALALVGGCREESIPTATATATTTAPETATPEATQTPEPAPTHVGGTEITEKGLGIYEQMGSGAEFSDSIDYVSQVWGIEITGERLTDPVVALQYACAISTSKGEEGLIYPAEYLGETTPPKGKEAEWRIMQNLAFYRPTLANVPSEEEQLETKDLTNPTGILINEGTQLTIVGQLLNQEILAVVTDYTRGVARSYFIRIPNHFPDDPENTSKVSLRNLLQRSGIDYDPQTKEIVLPLEEGTYRINKIIGQQLNEQLKQEMGIYFVNKMGDELIENPVVPYPDETLKDWQIAEETDADGEVSVVLTGKDDSGKETQLRASYDHENAKWTWAEMATSPEQELANAPVVAGLEAYIDGDTIRYKAEAENPYGLEAGEYAGYLFNFNDETGISSGKGMALAVEVRRVLLNQANTPEAIANEEWKITLPFDPRGETFNMKEVGTYSDIALSGLPPDTIFRSSFINEASTISYSVPGTYVAISVEIPEELLLESKQNKNYALVYYLVSASNIIPDNYSHKTVNFDDLVFSGIGESYLPATFPNNSQIILTSGSLEGPFNLSNHCLEIDKAKVFALEK